MKIRNARVQWNKSKAAERIHMLSVRENGIYIQPRVMAHCGLVIHYELASEANDNHSLRHTCAEGSEALVPFLKIWGTKWVQMGRSYSLRVILSHDHAQRTWHEGWP